MSSLLLFYNKYLCELLICGYSNIKVKNSNTNAIISNICTTITDYISCPNNLTNDTEYLSAEIEYLLFQQTKQAIDKYWQSGYWSFIRPENQLIHRNWYHIHTIKDKILRRAISNCIEFSYNYETMHNAQYRQQNEVYTNLDRKFKTSEKYINAAIDLMKKALEVKYRNKYKYLSQLLSMYEFYYFDHHILRFIKNKFDMVQSQKLLEALRRAIMMKLNESEKIEIVNIDFEEWNNSNSMKMSTLLQITTLVYGDDIDELMDELSDVINLIDVKYKTLELHLGCSILQSQDEFVNNNNNGNNGVGAKLSEYKSEQLVMFDPTIVTVCVPLAVLLNVRHYLLL